ncbi:MAG TPA: hypothetical protein VIC58_02215 [Actinomycetota bacterium]|jgi:hypothetical protein
MAAATLALAACGSHATIARMEAMMRPRSEVSSSPATNRIQVRGRFVKFTNLPCHRSDYYVGNKTVTFRGSDGSRTTIVTHSAQWTGLPADPPLAPLGQCRQVAAFEADLPTADRYVVVINDRRLPPVTLEELRAEHLRHTFRLPS